jgi:hypothetical protein
LVNVSALLLRTWIQDHCNPASTRAHKLTLALLATAAALLALLVLPLLRPPLGRRQPAAFHGLGHRRGAAGSKRGVEGGALRQLLLAQGVGLGA